MHGSLNTVKYWPKVSFMGSLSQVEESLSVHVFLLQKPFNIYTWQPCSDSFPDPLQGMRTAHSIQGWGKLWIYAVA